MAWRSTSRAGCLSKPVEAAFQGSTPDLSTPTHLHPDPSVCPLLHVVRALPLAHTAGVGAGRQSAGKQLPTAPARLPTFRAAPCIARHQGAPGKQPRNAPRLAAWQQAQPPRDLHPTFSTRPAAACHPAPAPCLDTICRADRAAAASTSSLDSRSPAPATTVGEAWACQWGPRRVPTATSPRESHSAFTTPQIPNSIPHFSPFSRATT